jgi:hypothetical protein
VTDHSPETMAARAATRELLRAVDGLQRRMGDSIDLRRLRTDAQRVAEDLELLVGPDVQAEPPKLMVIPDGDYPPELFADCDDEGVGPAHR